MILIYIFWLMECRADETNKRERRAGEEGSPVAPPQTEEMSTDSLACARLTVLPRKPDPSP